MGGGAIQHAETMTFQDFLAASQGDERLAWARFLYWHGCRTNPKYPYRQSDAWAAVFAKKEAETLCNHKSETGVDHLSIADAVLAELARQRKQAFEDGFETGMHTPSCFSSKS